MGNYLKKHSAYFLDKRNGNKPNTTTDPMVTKNFGNRLECLICSADYQMLTKEHFVMFMLAFSVPQPTSHNEKLWFSWL